MSDIRATFEIWAKSCHWALNRYAHGPYIQVDTEAGWQAWRACHPIAYADAVRDCAETVAYRKTSGGDGPINRQLNIIIEEIKSLAPQEALWTKQR
jgi:hypothetical protein